MHPVRVRVYGLPLTRSTYVFCLVGALLLLGVLAPLWWYKGQDQVAGLLHERLPALAPFVDWVPWLVAAAVALEAIEAFFVLRKFKRLELESQVKKELS